MIIDTFHEVTQSLITLCRRVFILVDQVVEFINIEVLVKGLSAIHLNLQSTILQILDVFM